MAKKPNPRTPPGGPGRFSRRTDGQQIATPGLGGPGPGGESSLQYGDVGKLEAGQRGAPLPVGTPPPRAPREAGQPVDRNRSLPPWLFEVDHPTQEPTTTGLDVGPGAGSEALDARPQTTDIRERDLLRLYLWYGNKDAFDLLHKIREERAAPAIVGGGIGPGPVPATARPPTEPVMEEPSEQTSAPERVEPQR